MSTILTAISEGGGVVLMPTTVNEQVDRLFAASLAVYTTDVVPTGKLEPEAAVVVTVGVVQLSVAVGAVQVAVAVVAVAAILTVMLLGQADRMGAVRSLAHRFVLVTVKLQVEVLPAISRAV
jgi:hypothetical protein